MRRFAISRRKLRRFLFAFVAFALLAASCGSSDDDDSAAAETTVAASESDDTDSSADSDDDSDDSDSTDAADEEMILRPGAGISVTPARGDWASTYFQNEVIAALVRELGYDVAEPAGAELPASQAFLAMAEGDVDYWASSWVPGHAHFQTAELSDGSIISDKIVDVGRLMPGGSIQGLLIEKNFADEYGITTIDEFNSNPEAIAAFDAVDPVPGNGVADIYGCQESWVCDDVIASQIAFNGWENIAQVVAGYEALVAEAIDKANSDTPFIIYTWGPSVHLTKLIPGVEVYWLAHDHVLDNSNPLNLDPPPPDMGLGQVGLGADVCPAVEFNSQGVCQIAFLANDIQVTANIEFLSSNPPISGLLNEIMLPVFDVSLALIQQDEGADPKELAAQWIADNRETVDGWLEIAREGAKVR